MVPRHQVERAQKSRRRRILLGVTADTSLMLMDGFPEMLDSRGWDVHVVSSPGPRLDSLAQMGNITTHAIPMQREPSPIADLVGLLRWVRLIRAVKPDVTSLGTPKAGLLGGLAGLVCRTPHRVYMLRGLRLETERGWRRGILMLIERLSMASSHIVLSVSPSLKIQARALKLCPEGKVRVLGSGSSNGVDLARFNPDHSTNNMTAALRRSLNIAQSPPVIGFVGRVTADKGLTDLALARRILDARGIDHHLLVVGRSDDQSGIAILTELNRAGRPAITVGFQSDLPAYYSIIDILCLPTHREGFPNVILEAAASQIPAATTNATGAVDSVVDRVTGLLCKVGDSEDLANNLQILIEDPELRFRLGAAARDRAHDEFDRDAVQNLQERFYSDLVGTEDR